MEYKFFLELQDGLLAEAFYTKHFKATAKKHFKMPNNHAYLYLFDKLPLLIYQSRNTEKRTVIGWHMIRFQASERQLWLDAIESIQSSDEDVKILTRNGISSNEIYGTAWFEFQDPFGVTWNLEIDRNAVLDLI